MHFSLLRKRLESRADNLLSFFRLPFQKWRLIVEAIRFRLSIEQGGQRPQATTSSANTENNQKVSLQSVRFYFEV